VKILLVDDEVDILTILKRFLIHNGHDVITALGPEEARLRASAQQFDIMLTDVEMPGTKGPDLANELRARQPSLRILFMSGSEPECPLPGPLVSKPCRLDDILAALHAASL